MVVCQWANTEERRRQKGEEIELDERCDTH